MLLTQRFPQLADRFSEHISASENWRTQSFRPEGDAGTTDENSARILLLAGTVIRFVYLTNPAVTEEHLPPAIEAAITKFKDAVRNIS